jgi:predicted metal-dependent hydrolase
VSDQTVVIGPDGRAKAYRPLAAGLRTAAIAAGLEAYDRGDYFLAHEALEPAWMGTLDRGERALLQGLIKVAAAYVHGARGNPAGIERNLEGARRLLGEAASGDQAWRTDRALDGLAHLDLSCLLEAIDLRLTDLAAHPDGPTLDPPTLSWSAE